jgi:hypothetical protein
MKFKWLGIVAMLCFIPCITFGEANMSITVYENESYGFRLEVPQGWQIYAENKTKGKVGLSLPGVWSETENQNVENAVVVDTYNSPKLNSLGDLINFEKFLMKTEKNKVIAMEKITVPDQGESFVYHAVYEGFEYVIKRVIYFQNKNGYVITFTATPGTYDLNIDKFERFLEGVSFFQPKN